MTIQTGEDLKTLNDRQIAVEYLQILHNAEVKEHETNYIIITGKEINGQILRVKYDRKIIDNNKNTSYILKNQIEEFDKDFALSVIYYANFETN